MFPGRAARPVCDRSGIRLALRGYIRDLIKGREISRLCEAQERGM